MITEADVKRIAKEVVMEILTSSGCTPSEWAEGIWKEATDLGLVTPKKNSGDKLGERPLGYATREQVAAIVLKGIKIVGGKK